MAKKSSGGQTSKSKSFPIETPEDMAADKIEDAQIAADEATEPVIEEAVEVAEEAVETAEETVADAAEDAQDILDEVTDEAPSTEDAIAEDQVEESITYEPEPQQSAASPVSEPAKAGGFVPLLLGGLVAGGIGYGIAYFQTAGSGTDMAALIAQQSDQIAVQADELATLRSDIAAMPTAADLGALEGAVADNGTQLSELMNRIDSSLATLEDRVVVIERQPSADGTLQETALAAFESDIAAMRDQIVAQQEELTTLLSDTRQEAASIESTAIANARAATARASLAIIQGSLESGAPFGNALSDLAGSLDAPVPAAIEAVAAEGVPTLAAIQAAYPEAAREALAVARREGASGEETSGMGAFLRNQFDVRSVEPQEGDSADAVLSRTEAALKDGRLNDALSEVASLPEVARGAMSAWTALAEQRAAALDAANTLASQLNVN